MWLPMFLIDLKVISLICVAALSLCGRVTLTLLTVSVIFDFVTGTKISYRLFHWWLLKLLSLMSLIVPRTKVSSRPFVNYGLIRIISGLGVLIWSELIVIFFAPVVMIFSACVFKLGAPVVLIIKISVFVPFIIILFVIIATPIRIIFLPASAAPSTFFNRPITIVISIVRLLSDLVVLSFMFFFIIIIWALLRRIIISFFIIRPVVLGVVFVIIGIIIAPFLIHLIIVVRGFIFFLIVIFLPLFFSLEVPLWHIWHPCSILRRAVFVRNFLVIIILIFLPLVNILVLLGPLGLLGGGRNLWVLFV